jgi:hypothetical protein
LTEKGAIVIERVADADRGAESVTVTVNEKWPATLGVPVMDPALWSLSPAGSAPAATDQV